MRRFAHLTLLKTILRYEARRGGVCTFERYSEIGLRGLNIPCGIGERKTRDRETICIIVLYYCTREDLSKTCT